MRQFFRLATIRVINRALMAMLFFTVLAGCVQSANYKNSGKPTTEHRINTDEAAETRIALGLQYLKVGEMSNAKFNLEKALNFAPELPAVHTAFAYYYQRVDENELAEKSYLKALSYDSNDADALNNYGVFLCKVKQYTKAENAFLKAIKVPSYLQVAQSYENAAICALENLKYTEAKKYFGLSLDHSALRANTLINMASLSYAMGDHQDAQKYTQRLSNIGVVSPRVLLLRALVELKLGNITQSKKYGTTLVSMYIKSPEALAYLSKKFDNTEFEQQRKRYLKHQYDQFKATQTTKADNRQSTFKGDGKIAVAKIKRKIMPQAAANTAEPEINVVKPQTLPQEVVVSPTKAPTLTQLMANADAVSETSGVSAAPVLLVSETAEPVTAEPVTAEPVTAEPVTAEPVTAESVTAEPVTAELMTVVATKPQKTTEMPFHVVKKGEYLYDISIKYNIRLKPLMQWNELSENALLKVGQKVYLKDPRLYHVIVRGDTLFAISLKYNVLLKKLLQWNDLNVNTRLKLGQRILIVNPKHPLL